MKKAPFHLSLPCLSISQTKRFYIDILGAKLGRSAHQWLDIDLFGNQITFTKSGGFDFSYKSYKFENTVLPSFHFGVIVDKETWGAVYDKLMESNYEVTTKVTFLEDKVGEHISFFIEDPNKHNVEFKSFQNVEEMFER
ncbi:VOC family protein [Maribacter sp. 2210JD10-5]|uniref:VOC family protein n=1 Tax=Maribacter sp. 2210JD10-5 TaxID=3386272 RepID=UPI0039BD513A